MCVCVHLAISPYYRCNLLVWSWLHADCIICVTLLLCRKAKYRNLNELIDDKSHRAEFRDMYTKFGVIDTEGSLYNDEYDDTYDYLDVSVREEGDLER